MTLEEFLEKLERVEQHGGYYKARCPNSQGHSHGDTNPSLKISVNENGWIDPHCFAGCTREDVLSALGLENIELLTTAINYGEPDFVFPYQAENGDILFEAVRFPGKRFKQRHLGEDAEWIWNLDGVRRVLYHLPEVIEGVKAGRWIYICEGEKDVERLRELGLVATCNPMGAGKWHREYGDYLEGANVVILADRDPAGRKHAERVKTSLQGIAADIKVFQARIGKDVSDHLDAGLDFTDLEPLRNHVRRGIVTAREMVEGAREELTLGEQDIPGYVLSPHIPLVFRQGRTYAIGAYTGHGKTSYALPGFRNLAQQGHRVGYFCVSPTQRILTSDLRWVQAGKVEVGQELVGFAEELEPYTGKMSGAKVLNNRIIRRPVYRVVTDRGTIEASAEHPLVCSREFKKNSFRREWVETQYLKPGDQLSFFLEPWEPDEIDAEDRGYLAAAFDGEGCIGGGSTLSFFQNHNPMLEKVLSLLSKYEFDYSVLSRSNRQGMCIRLMKNSAYRFLGIAQPPRLMPKARTFWEGKRIWGKNSKPANVLKVEYLGEKDVCALGTTTGTFISEGFLSHNSLEMPERDLRNKLLAHKGIPLRLTEEPWKISGEAEMLGRYNESLSEIEKWNADIIFESNISADRIAEITEEREYEAIFVDHIHKLAWGERRGFEEQIQRLNGIALELNVMVVLCCQFRKFDMRPGAAAYPRPTLQSFRETSMIAEEASMALAIWRQTDESGTQFTGQTLCFLLKNRHRTSPADADGSIFGPLNFDRDREMFVPHSAGVEE